ncbi:MAG: hypothetical protein JKX67_02430 [Colwellia sp.]|nr:hypothetical protein [Colwellia sp.]
MTTLNGKNISVALLLTLSVLFSLNSHAAESTSIEHSISELVIAQGKQVMSELSEQLQQSITAELNSFTINFSFDESIAGSLAWLHGEQKAPIKIESDNSLIETKQVSKNKSL